MKNTITQTVLKILAVLAIVAAVIVLAIAYTNMSKSLKDKSSQEKPTTTSQPEQVNSTVPIPSEGNIGTVVNLVTQPNGTVTLTIDTQGPTGQKTYQLPKDQQVKLYTSSTQTTIVPITQLNKEMIVNVIKYTNPERYVVVGVTDKGLVEKLL